MNVPSRKLASAVALALGVQLGCMNAQAATPLAGDVLTIDDGVAVLDAYGNTTSVTGGSWFGMDTSAEGKIAGSEQTAINGLNGITIGSTQAAGEIDTWSFFGNPGNHWTTVAPTGDTTTGLDFSGWTVNWNTTPVIPMGAGAWTPGNCGAAWMGCTSASFGEGVAFFEWDGVYGSTYSLWYSATVPVGDPSGFGGVAYIVRLTGTVLSGAGNAPPSATPVAIASVNVGATANWAPVVDDVNSDPLTCSIEAGDEPANGTATVAPDCTSGTYTHDGGAGTTDSFTYTVTDGTDSDTALVTVAITTGGGGGGGGTPGTLPNGVVTLLLEPGDQQLSPDGSKLDIPTGSWFGMDTDGNSRMAGSEKTALEPGPDGGLIVGAAQSASGSHSGFPNGTENAGVDAPWNFFGNTGLDFTATAPTAIGGNTGNGIDMSGWRVTWNSIPSINMGTGAWSPGNCDALGITTCSFANGTGQFTWTDVDASGGISDGDTYRLIYAATVPPGDPSGFGNVRYLLNLEGTLSVTAPPTTSVGTLQDGDLGGTLSNGYRATQALPADDGYSNVGGFFDYRVNCGAAGCSADVYIPLSAPVPANAVLRKYGVTPGNPAGGWATFAPGGGDTVASGSSASGGGSCAGATYSGGLTAGHDCLRITQTDGGPNDTDPTAGIIGDPSGIAVAAGVAAAPNLSSGSSGCTIANGPVPQSKAGDWLLVALALVGLTVFRRRAI